ncbi:MAG: DNA adenine methylase [Clostridia bacterium]|nr:DNA adenine methylase [Clostridia bacterium]
MEEKAVKPFLKWAGGKSQLLNEIKQRYPLSNNHITRYVEPFVGGGAVLFDILNNFNIKDIYINDINEELINAYRVIKENVNELIDILKLYQSEYTPLNTEKRKFYYTEKRKRFNELKIKKNKKENIEKAALMIFLNKTCFNGLYRVNKSGYFNVPMGSYKNPLICDENNLRAVSRKLQKVTIMCGDYKKLINLIDENTFVYFDPPYKPLTNTANFTSYTENSFDDKKQIELSNFINEIHKKGAKILLSNSDPKNSNPKDNFFDILYSDYKIKRVDATRMINCSGKSRGKIKELLISNF